jgi:hypothetical protein
MVKKSTYLYPGTNHSLDCYSGLCGERNIVVFVKSHCATTLDKISYAARSYLENMEKGQYEVFGLDKTEASRKNMFYRFDLNTGTQRTVADEDTRQFIENFIEQG